MSLWKINMMSWNYQIIYMTQTIVPHVEQLRPQLDNRNLYALRIGNPDLRQSYSHTFTGDLNRMFGGSNSSLQFLLMGSYTQNSIVPSTRFFTEDTPLPEYGGYTAPAGSSLTTYRNIDGLSRVDFRVNYKRPVGWLKSTLTLVPSVGFDRSPSLRENTTIYTVNWSPAMNVSLTTNFSRKVQLTVGSTTTYTYSNNNIGDSDRYLREAVSANATFDQIFKRFVLKANYRGIFYRRMSDGYRDNSNILNVSFGCKILKRMGEVNVAVFDLLNDTSGFSTAMGADYVMNSWREMFGRYFLINFALKFNSTGASGKGYQGMLNDGSTTFGKGMVFQLEQ